MDLEIYGIGHVSKREIVNLELIYQLHPPMIQYLGSAEDASRWLDMGREEGAQAWGRKGGCHLQAPQHLRRPGWPGWSGR